MRILLVNNHDIADSTAGMIHSFRTMLRWLVEAGHECRILTTRRLEPGSNWLTQDPVQLDGIMVYTTTLAEYGRTAASLLAHADLVLACNGEPLILDVLRQCRQRGILTVYAIRGYGYDHWQFFEHVDHVLTCSAFLSDYYRTYIGLESTPLEPPILWADVVAPQKPRDCLTFVHPAPHKGLAVFTAIARTLQERRPDIPLLVVQSCAATLPAGVHLLPPVDRPAQFLARTRLLLVPSVWEEPWGRVAAEAMINGIPPIVSDRGALADVVGGDRVHGARVVPVPHWMTPQSTRVPGPREVAGWVEAICELWDDRRLYREMAARARAYAATRFSEADARRRHLGYFTSRWASGTLAG